MCISQSLHNTDSENMKCLFSSFHWPKVEIHVHHCEEVVSKQVIGHPVKFAFRTTDFNLNLTQIFMSKWKLNDELGIELSFYLA